MQTKQPYNLTTNIATAQSSSYVVNKIIHMYNYFYCIENRMEVKTT